MFYSFNKLFKNYVNYQDIFLIIIKKFFDNYKEVFLKQRCFYEF